MALACVLCTTLTLALLALPPCTKMILACVPCTTLIHAPQLSWHQDNPCITMNRAPQLSLCQRASAQLNQGIAFRFLPSVIKGDLDSIRPEVLAFYKGLGVPVVDSSADQDTTDLTKCIAYIEEHLKLEEAQLQEAHCISPRICAEAAEADQRRYQQLQESKQQQGAPNGSISQQEQNPSAAGPQPTQLAATPNDGHGSVQGSTPGLGSERVLLQKGVFLQHKHQIIVLGALGGRLDHTLAAINTLHMFPDLNIILLGDGNLVRLLPQGRSVIKPDRSAEGPMCGLVPMRGAATATST
ncbi:thiamine pyrophosphokinase, partial [Dunaliella salina]